MTQYLEHAEGRIAYDDSGRGPLVICSPSMGDVRGEYRFLIPQLVNAGYRAVSMDVRGHGETSVRWSDYTVAGIGSDMLALVRALNVGPAILVGNSMSGGAAVWAAVEAPELASGLVLIDPVVRGEGTWLSGLLYRLLFARPWGPSLWARYYTSLYPLRKPDDFVQYRTTLRANLAQLGRVEALTKMILASKRASAERVAKVRAPAIVLMGSRDPDFKAPEEEARWLAQHLNGQYQMISGAGHYPHAEVPDLTGPLIMSFLHSLTQQGVIAHAA